MLDDDFPGQDLANALDEKAQKIEHKGLDMDRAFLSAQRILMRVEFKPIEAIPHEIAPVTAMIPGRRLPQVDPTISNTPPRSLQHTPKQLKSDHR
jgi:hypothetical protein